MKIIYENCGVKKYIKEYHHSYRRNFLPEKMQACKGFEPLTPL